MGRLRERPLIAFNIDLEESDFGRSSSLERLGRRHRGDEPLARLGDAHREVVSVDIDTHGDQTGRRAQRSID